MKSLPYNGAETTPREMIAMPESQELRFFDWAHVEKGLQTATYDPERLSEAGRASMEQRRADWNIVPDLSGHGMKRVKMPYGVRVTPEKAQKSDPWLETDRPWESAVSAYVTVLHEDGRYRLWYRVELTEAALAEMFPPGIKREPSNSAFGYAESTDGLTWTKPDLDVYRFQGRPTNIVCQFGDATGVFRDDSAPPEERYKGFDWDRLADAPEDAQWNQKYGLWPVVSPDGYHWTRLPEPALRYFHDTQNIAAWDALLGKYVGYFRGHLHGRAISRSETDDFRSWPPAQVFLYPGPEDAVADDYYTNCFTTYPGDPAVRLLFPAIYRHNTDDLCLRMAVSRDNRAWNWVSHEPVLEIGEPGAWDCGSLYASPNLVRLPDGRLALPYAGTQVTHNEDFAPYYKDYPPTQYQLAWATWPEGRLAGLEAADHGEFWCNLTLAGEELAVNARTTRAGSVEVALHEPYGWESKPLPGCQFEDCSAFTGDAVAGAVRWTGAAELASRQGQTLLAHVRLNSAKLFSLGGAESAAEREARGVQGLR